MEDLSDMRLLFIADGRSPIATNWIRYFAESMDEVHLISTFPCETDLPLDSYSNISVAFSGTSQPSQSPLEHKVPGGASGIGLRTIIRHWLGPFTVLLAARRLRESVDAIRPDLIHAMRIPFEGILAEASDPPSPLIVSVWGNDFTLHAPASPFMRKLTRRTLFRADGLHVDCMRDKRLAIEWGFPENHPVTVLPGGGGIKTDVFFPKVKGDNSKLEKAAFQNGLSEDAEIVVNPRGFRAYVRNDTFFKSIPFILDKKPQTRFYCPAMAGEKQAEVWIKKLGIEQAVRLLPKLSQEKMASLLRVAAVTVSPSEHDGTPNTLLETMASGSFPVAGDLESIREWIRDGVNGLLVDPDQPESLARAVLQALGHPELRQEAAVKNVKIIRERAIYENVMSKARSFYLRMLEQ
jgi:glycosyltransferase involved in cell wall biosynthesis